jgi:hypothetical protein
VKRRRIGNKRIVEIDRVKAKELISFVKTAGLKPDAGRWLVREAITQARSIIKGKRLEFDPHSIQRTIKAIDNLTRELASLSSHVQELYPRYLSPKPQRSARSVGKIKLDLERLSAGLGRMLDRLRPSRGAPKLIAVEDYVFACAHRWQQAGGNPGRRAPNWKGRWFREKEHGPFGQFLRLAFEVAGGDPSQITEHKIKEGVARFKSLMEKNTC